MSDRIVLRVVALLLLPCILLFGFYILLHGEVSPGGGFQAGVILASAFLLYGLVYGVRTTMQVLPFGFVKAIACAGIFAYMGVGAASMLQGGKFLDYSILSTEAVMGQKLGILLVELGICMTVFASVILLYYAFAGRGGK